MIIKPHVTGEEKPPLPFALPPEFREPTLTLRFRNGSVIRGIPTHGDPFIDSSSAPRYTP